MDTGENMDLGGNMDVGETVDLDGNGDASDSWKGSDKELDREARSKTATERLTDVEDVERCSSVLVERLHYEGAKVHMQFDMTATWKESSKSIDVI
nr:hypothetical protein BaRGS_016725 [Batillaria attramentaria]